MNDIAKKEFTKVPFTPYDVFGYFIPGASFLIGAYFYDFLINEGIKNSSFLPIYSIFHNSIVGVGENFILGVIYLVILIISAYVLGHIIASISSHFLDRMLVEKGHGYPLQLLLKMNTEVVRKGRISAFIRGAFFWINIYFILQYCGFVYKIYFLTAAANIVIVFFLIYSAISLIFLIIYKKNPEVDPSRIEKNFLNVIQNLYNYSMMKIFAGPYDFISYLYSIIIRTRETFDDEFIKKYKSCFQKKFDYNPEDARTNNYWFAFLFVSEKSPFASGLINNWLFLYSFARNLSTSLLMLFIYAFISVMYQENISSVADYLLSIPLMCFTAYLIMLTRYYYLYKNYYTKFIIRSFVFLNEIQK